MTDKLVAHIKNKLYDKDEILDGFDSPTDETIRRVMIMTFEVITDQCLGCYFCQNRRRFTLNSLCKIKHHSERDCFHFRLDSRKVVDRKFYHIMSRVGECYRGKRIIEDLMLSAKTKKKHHI